MGAKKKVLVGKRNNTNTGSGQETTYEKGKLLEEGFAKGKHGTRGRYWVVKGIWG